MPTIFDFKIRNSKVVNNPNLKKEFSEACLKECPLESCFSEKFSSFMSTDNKIIIGLSQTVFSFSFRDLSSLNISQIPKTDGFTFINNIGGGLGLFMGLAFPSFVEFLQFLAEILLIAIFH